MISAAEFYKWMVVFGLQPGGGGGGVTPEQVQQFAFNVGESVGTDDAFVVNLDPAVTELTDGLVVILNSLGLENLTDEPTLQVNALDPVDIVLWDGTVVAIGDIQPGGMYILIYDEDDDTFRLINPDISIAKTYLVQANSYNTGISNGTANALNVVLTPPPLSTLSTGFPLVVQANATNTDASTLTLNGVTKDIELVNGDALVGGEIVNQQVFLLIFNASADAWVLVNPVSGSGTIAGGTNGQLQYNNAGILDGDSIVTDGDGAWTGNIGLDGNMGVTGIFSVSGSFGLTGNSEITGNMAILGRIDVDNLRLDGDTLSSISSSGTQFVFGTNTLDFLTNSVSRLDINNSGVRFGGANARITSILSDTTLSGASDTNTYTGLALKTYIDLIGAGFTFVQAAFATFVSDFDSVYDNGTDGVGATLTASSNGELTVDGFVPQNGDPILVPAQNNSFENGLYSIVQGDISNPSVLTRLTSFDTPAQILPGVIIPVLFGDTQDGTFWVQSATVTTIGTDPIVITSFLKTGAPASPTGSLQYNNGGVFGADNIITDGAGNWTGTLTLDGALTVDNVNINGATISTESGDEDLTLAPHGTGFLNIPNTLSFKSTTDDTRIVWNTADDILEIYVDDTLQTQFSAAGFALRDGSVFINSISDDDTLTSASNENTYTGLALKTYIDTLFDSLFLSDTWTPAISGGTTPGVPTYTSRSGFFSVVGGSCIAWFEIELSGLGGMEGDLLITNLPVNVLTGGDNDIKLQGSVTYIANTLETFPMVINGNTDTTCIVSNGEAFYPVTIEDTLSDTSIIRGYIAYQTATGGGGGGGGGCTVPAPTITIMSPEGGDYYSTYSPVNVQTPDGVDTCLLSLNTFVAPGEVRISATELDYGNVEYIAPPLGTWSALTTLSLPNVKAMPGLSQTMIALTSFSAPELTFLTAGLNLTGLDSLNVYELPSLLVVGGGFTINNTSPLDVSLPLLESIDGTFQLAGAFRTTSFSVPSLKTIVGSVTVANGTLSELDFPVLEIIVGSLAINGLNTSQVLMPNLLQIGGSWTGTNTPAVTTVDVGDLESIGGAFSVNMPNVTTLNIASLQNIDGDFASTLSSLSTLNFASLEVIGGNFTSALSSVTTFSVPLLTTLGGTFNPAGLGSLTVLSFPALESVASTFNWIGASLVEVNLPSILDIGGSISSASSSPNLTTVSWTSGLLRVGGNVSLIGAALSEASVDEILVRLAALDGSGGTTLFNNRTVNLSGGTSSPPSSTGLTAKTTLESRGCTVTVNV